MRRRRLCISIGTSAALIALVAMDPSSAPAASYRASSVTTIATSKSSTVYDSRLTMTATVSGSGGIPTGSVTFVDASNGSNLGSATLQSGKAVFDTASLAVGSRDLEAEYEGDVNFLPSSSSPAHVTVSSGPSDSVTYQVDPGHDGDQTVGSLSVYGLKKLWSVTLGTPDDNGPEEAGDVSYPVVGDGLVFVTVEDSTGQDGVVLYALDPSSGHIVWQVPISGDFSFVGLAYDGRQLFALDDDGGLFSFDARTGRQLWAESLQGQEFYDAPPTAFDGDIYISTAAGDGLLMSVRESDGSVLWSQPVSDGFKSSPAVSDAGVFVSYACQQDYRFTLTGDLVWHDVGGCEGGGGSTGVLHGSYYYARGAPFEDTPSIFAASTGASTSTFDSVTAPGFDANSFFTNAQSGANRSISAIPLDGGSARWTSLAPSGLYITAPVVIGDVVYVGDTDGTVYGLSARTGDVVWSQRAGNQIVQPDEHDEDTLVGLAIGDGKLFVPAGRKLVAFG